MPSAANNNAPRPKSRPRRRKIAGAARRSADELAGLAAGTSRADEAGRADESSQPDQCGRPGEHDDASEQVHGDEQPEQGPDRTEAVLAEQTQEQAAVSGEGSEKQGPDRRTVVTRVLVGVLGVCVLVCGYFGVGFYTLANGASTGNTAVSDPAGTKQVAAEVSQAVQTSFTYDYANAQRTEQEAGKVLTGSAIRQYQQLFGQVKQVAPAEKLVFTSQVRSAGVQELRGDRARVLLFVDQQGVRADTNQRRSGSAQLEVTAQHIGYAWKVSEIRVL